MPPEEALRRFREGLVAPKALDGPASRDELLQRFMTAVKKRDRAALRSLVVSRAEFAFLAYPELSISRPPLRQPPEVAWLLLDAAAEGSISKLMTSAATRFELLGYECGAPPVAQGALRLQSGCTVRVREGSEHKSVRLFRSIIERDGRWKFLSIEGDL